MKKSAAFALIACLLFIAIAACDGSGNDANSVSPGTNQNSSAGAGNTADPSGGPLKITGEGIEPYETPLKVSVYFGDDGVSLFRNGEDWGNNVWTRAYKEYLNVDIELAGVSPYEELSGKMAMMFSSGTLPDIFYLDAPNLQGFARSDALANLREYEDSANALVKRYLYFDDGVAYNRFNGYGVPSFSTLHDDSVNLIAIRTDWLDNLGMPEPRNWNDILAIIEAFATKDPDGNGRNDTWGIAVDMMIDGVLSGVADLQGFFNAYRAYQGRWIDDGNGGIKYGSIQEEMIRPLSVLADFYAKGYIDPEFYTKDRWTVRSDIHAGKIGLAFQVNWSPANWEPLYETLGEKLKFYPVMSADDGPVEFYFLDWWAMGGMVVSKEFSNPEVIFKMMNLEINAGANQTELYDDYFRTVEGYTPAKYMVVSSVAAPDLSYNHYRMYQDAFDRGLTPNDLDSFGARRGFDNILGFMDGSKNDRDSWMAYMMYGPGKSVYSVYDFYEKNNMIKMDRFTGEPTKTMRGRSSALQWEEIGAFQAIIKGEQPIDYFQTFVENWKQAGGDLITEEILEWYESQN